MGGNLRRSKFHCIAENREHYLRDFYNVIRVVWYRNADARAGQVITCLNLIVRYFYSFPSDGAIADDADWYVGRAISVIDWYMNSHRRVNNNCRWLIHYIKEMFVIKDKKNCYPYLMCLLQLEMFVKIYQSLRS